MNSTIEKRQVKEKELLIEQLKRSPVVQIACEKIGVGRATYYRWHNQDKEFAENSDKAIQEGNSLVNDMAESQLMSAIRDKNMTAIIFWLKHHHSAYATRVEISQADSEDKDQLKPEEEEKVKKALRLAGILIEKEKEEENGRTGT